MSHQRMVIVSAELFSDLARLAAAACKRSLEGQPLPITCTGWEEWAPAALALNSVPEWGLE